jgi:hypothetical protein
LLWALFSPPFTTDPPPHLARHPPKRHHALFCVFFVKDFAARRRFDVFLVFFNEYWRLVVRFLEAIRFDVGIEDAEKTSSAFGACCLLLPLPLLLLLKLILMLLLLVVLLVVVLLLLLL